MARQKKQNKPRHVSIYYDQILYDLDFMTNEQAGIILKMIVWYSAGNPEGKERIAEMQQYIDKLPPMGKAWLTSVYKRLFACIDEDLSAYAEICEKRRQAVAKREEYKRNQMVSNDNNSNQMISNDNKDNIEIPVNDNGNQMISSDNNSNQMISSVIHNDTDTDTDTELSNDNVNIEEDEEEEARARKKNLPRVKIKDFRKMWNKIYDFNKENKKTCRIHKIKPGDLPGDAEERLNKRFREIYDNLTEDVANELLEIYGYKPEEAQKMEVAAKLYLGRAIENMAAVKMKIDDTSFGSFQWLMKSQERIRRIYDRDIQ